MTTIGEMVRAARKGAGMTMVQLATACGLAGRNSIHVIEARGDGVSLGLALRIADAVDMPADERGRFLASVVSSVLSSSRQKGADLLSVEVSCKPAKPDAFEVVLKKV